MKKVLLKISRNSQENTCARASFLINLQTSGLELHLKQKNLAHVPSCEFCDIFKNTFYRTLPLAVWHCLFFSFSCSKRWNTRLFISNTFFQLNLLKALRQLVWRFLQKWKNALDWKKCRILMFSEIFSPYGHVLASLFRK